MSEVNYFRNKLIQFLALRKTELPLYAPVSVFLTATDSPIFDGHVVRYDDPLFGQKVGRIQVLFEGNIPGSLDGRGNRPSLPASAQVPTGAPATEAGLEPASTWPTAPCQNVRNVLYRSRVWRFTNQSLGCSPAGPELLSLGPTSSFLPS